MNRSDEPTTSNTRASGRLPASSMSRAKPWTPPSGPPRPPPTPCPHPAALPSSVPTAIASRPCSPGPTGENYRTDSKLPNRLEKITEPTRKLPDRLEKITEPTRKLPDRLENYRTDSKKLPNRLENYQTDSKKLTWAVNAGIRETRGDLIAFTDDDVGVDADWARALVTALDAPEYVGAGGRIVADCEAAVPRWMRLDGPARLMHVGSFDVGPAPAPLRVPPFGANMAFRRDVFERHGLFRTDLGPGPGRYLPGQDTEFGSRLLRAGARLAWVPGAIVRHRVRPDAMTQRYVTSWSLRPRTDVDPHGTPRRPARPRVRRARVAGHAARRYRARVALLPRARAALPIEGRGVAPGGRHRRVVQWLARAWEDDVSVEPAHPDIGVVAMVPDRFDHPWQSRHHVLTRLARYLRVVWVEPPREWRDSLRRRSVVEPVPVEPAGPDDIAVYRAPWWLPIAHRPRPLARWLDRARAVQIQRMLVSQGCQSLVLSLWRPEMERTLRSMSGRLSLFHIDDDYRFSRAGDWPDGREVRLASSVDAVVTHSRELHLRNRHLNPNTIFMPNGVDYTLYTTPWPEPSDLAAIPHPRVGYTGYVKPQLDWPLLASLAGARPDWHFVFVGPVSRHPTMPATVADLSRRPNVHFLPFKSQAELAAYPQHFDVCVMPYTLDRYSRSVYPLKLHEYLASGRPVVSTPIEAVREFADVVTTATTTEAWVHAIQGALEPFEPFERAAAARRAVARRFDWDDIVRQLAALILRGLDERAGRAQGRPRNSRSA